MGGEGSMSAMNSSLKNNRNLLKQRTNAFNREKKETRTGSYKKTLRFKRVSAVKLEKIRRKIRAERREQKMRMSMALILTGIILFVVVITIKHFYF